MTNPLQSHLTQLKAEFDEVLFDAFVAPCVVQQEQDRYLILAPNNATEAWLKRHLAAPLAAALAADDDPRRLDFALMPADARPAVASDESLALGSEPRQPTPSQPRRPNTAANTGLVERYTFDNFISGKANEAALSLAQHIAKGQATDTLPNPFFLYGSTGLGKTHLAHALGNAYLQNDPSRRVLLTTAQAYKDDVVRAYKLDKAEAFKQRYQHLDLLIIDDIQYMGGDKVRTQEEFFYLFNHLNESNKSIVVTCDRAPTRIDKFPPRLVSRLNAGASITITPPEFELRVEILTYKAKKMGSDLPTEVIHFIAEHIKSSVRELEGAVMQVILRAGFERVPATIPSCRRVLANLIAQTQINNAAYPDLIKEKVAEHYHIRTAELSSRSRQGRIVLPRHVAAYLCRQMTDLSLPEIARHFNRNHTTIIHSCNHIEQKIAQDSDFKEDLKFLQMSIKDSLS